MPYFEYHGHRLFYRNHGNGTLLLILAGNTASSACHLAEIEHFGQHYRAVGLDFWGTGQSDRLNIWPDDWYQQGAHDAVALISHLGYERAIIMGASGGGAVALWTAILYPERVQAVIADSVVNYIPPYWMRELIMDRGQKTPQQVQFWQTAHGADWEQVVEADSAMLMHLMESKCDIFDTRLGEVACPVLLTASLADEMLPEVGVHILDMADHIPDCRLFFTNQGNHPLMWSRPDDFRTNVNMFLKTIS